MARESRARILVVGTELLAGKADRNGPEIARRLKRRGIRVDAIEIVPDDRAALRAAIESALGAASLVVTTGGIGPTEDDLTREALCDAVGGGLVEDEDARRRIEELYRERGRQANALSLRQALRHERAEPIPNPTGFAVGAVLALESSVVVMLPGPPSELQAMADRALDRAEAMLAERGFAAGAHPIVAEIVLAGIGESDAAARVAHLPAMSGLDVAWLARPGEVRLVLAHGEDARVREAVAVVRAELGRDVVSVDGRGLAEVVLATLRDREESMVVAESCTGGLLAAELTSIPGSSACFRGGFVTYANDAKVEMLGVPEELIAEHGAVSAEVAEAMAFGARRAGRADWAASITGIAGPGGATPGKPVGLVHWAVALPDGRVESWKAIFTGGRDDVRRRAAAAALDAIRRCQ